MQIKISFYSKKLFFFIFLFSIFLYQKLNADQKFKIIATVNNEAITNIDLLNEIEIIKIINAKKNLNNQNLENIAINTLIDEKIKMQEIIKEGIEIDKNLLNNLLTKYLTDNKINDNLNNKYKKLIKQKIYITFNWNKLISKKYSWKININMNEINQKILKIKKKEDEEKITLIRENLIDIEKTKKLNVYSNYHFNKIKNNTLVKIL